MVGNGKSESIRECEQSMQLIDLATDKIPPLVPRRVSSSFQGCDTSLERQAISKTPHRLPPALKLSPGSNFDSTQAWATSYSPKHSTGQKCNHPLGPASTDPEIQTQRQSLPPATTVYAPPSLYPSVADGSQWSPSTRPQHNAVQLAEPVRTQAPTAFREPSSESALSKSLAHQVPLSTNSAPSITSPSFLILDLRMTSARQYGHSYPSAYPQPQKLYPCPTCTKLFSRPSSLIVHTRSHTGQKPYRCSYASCGKSYSVKSNLRRHEKGHGGPLSKSSHG